MAWLRQPEAALALDISPRTLTRRITNGEVDTKRDGKRVLVFVDGSDDPVANVAIAARQLTEMAAAQAVERHNNDQTVAAVFQSHAETKAELRRLRWGAFATTVAFMAAAAFSVWIVVDAADEADQHSDRLQAFTAASNLETVRQTQLEERLGDTVGQLRQVGAELAEANGRAAIARAQRDVERDRRLELEDTVRALREQLAADDIGAALRRWFTPPVPEPDQLAVGEPEP